MKTRCGLSKAMKLFAASGLALAAVSAGAQLPQPDAKAMLDADTAMTQAKTAAIQAETARINAQISALGLKNEATGTTSLKDKGGEMEGWMLSAGTLAKAGNMIADAVRQKANGATVVLLAADAKFGLHLPATLGLEMDGLGRQMTRAGATCGAAPPPPGKSASLSLPIAAVGAVLGAIKTDTEIYGFAGPSEARMLVNAIAATQGQWIVPTDAVRPSASSKIEARWTALQDQASSLFACRARLDVRAPRPAAEIAVIDRALTAVDSFNTRVAQAASGEASLLAQAIQSEAIDADALVLRVYLEKAGGSLLLRKNLWTALGAPAVGITGGAVISYRLSRPSSGSPVVAGLLVCRTTLTSMRAIQDGRASASECRAPAR